MDRFLGSGESYQMGGHFTRVIWDQLIFNCPSMSNGLVNPPGSHLPTESHFLCLAKEGNYSKTIWNFRSVILNGGEGQVGAGDFRWVPFSLRSHLNTKSRLFEFMNL